MTWTATTLPDDPAALPGWLEAQLVGPDLGQLVAELRAVRGDGSPDRPLAEVLGRQASTVLTAGLGSLPRDALRYLLRHPQLLLELQEQVLTEGGAYWSALPAPAEITAAADRGWQRLRPAARHADDRPTPAAPRVDPVESRPRVSLARHFLPYAATCLATAAAVLVVVYAAGLGRPGGGTETAAAAAPWGWQKPDAFPSGLDRTAYLNHLADEADEWFAKRPATSGELAGRIGEFRQGCSALKRAGHPALPDADRAWLKERCAVWSRKLDDQLARLDDTGDVDAIRAEADATVRQLTKAIRDRVAAGA